MCRISGRDRRFRMCEFDLFFFQFFLKGGIGMGLG